MSSIVYSYFLSVAWLFYYFLSHDSTQDPIVHLVVRFFEAPVLQFLRLPLCWWHWQLQLILVKYTVRCSHIEMYLMLLSGLNWSYGLDNGGPQIERWFNHVIQRIHTIIFDDRRCWSCAPYLNTTYQTSPLDFPHFYSVLFRISLPWASIAVYPSLGLNII